MNSNLEAARQQMIDQQVRAWEVLDDRVLETLASVPREEFVPEAYHDVAFADAAIPLGHGQAMLPPKIEGRILQALALSRSDDVLEIGTGSGFFAACLARMAARVRSVDIYPDFVEGATKLLKAHLVTNVTVAAEDASTLTDTGRYDAIAVTASLPVYDPRFERALKVGGRLFVVVGTEPVMEARLVTRVAAEEWVAEALFETVLTPLVNARKATAFVF
jgi:protein-L-isoaspartate(D-aspartate) O-methyltransferase